MTAPAVHTCARGARCHAAVRDGELLVGAPCDRPLCDTCETAVRRVLEQVPDLYVRLRIKTRDHDVVARGPQVVVSKTKPLPLHGQALHLGEELVWLLTSWETAVRHIANLTPADRNAKREGPVVVAAARTLTDHLTAWINADVWELPTSATTPDVQQTGAQAAGALLDWRATVRTLAGFDPKADRAIHRYPEPCPTCGVAAITHRAGMDHMECQNCRATAPYGVLGQADVA